MRGKRDLDVPLRKRADLVDLSAFGQDYWWRSRRR